jgi:hypothetical protein
MKNIEAACKSWVHHPLTPPSNYHGRMDKTFTFEIIPDGKTLAKVIGNG